MKNITKLILVLFSINITVSYGQTCTNGYVLGQPLGLVTNGDFSVNGGTTPFATLTASNNPTNDQGLLLPSIGFYSQARRGCNNCIVDGTATSMLDEDKFNSITLQSGYNHLPSYLKVGDFQGESSFNVPAETTWALTNGNAFISWSPTQNDGKEFVVWGQNVTGLTINQPYTFYFYLNNALSNTFGSNFSEPYIRLRTGGSVGLPNGNVAVDAGLISASDDAIDAQNGWRRYSYSFVASSTSMIFKITDHSDYYLGDDLAIAAIDLIQCIPTVTTSNNITVCSGATGNISVSTTSTGTFTYSWTGPNGYTATGTSPIIINMTSAKQGYYVATITDNVGVSNKDSVLVSMIAGPNVSAGADQSICEGSSATITGSGASTYSWNQSLGSGASKTVSPTNTTNYTVTGTDGNGCVDTDIVRVTVNSLPSVTLSSSGAICEGESRVLTASGVGSSGASYSWASPLSGTGRVKTVTPSSTTTYTVTGTNSNNCSNTASATVTVNSLPIANAGVNQSICLGDNTGISASATGGTSPYSYSWNRGLGVGASQTITPPTTLNYTVTVIDDNSCTDTDVVRVTVNSLPNVILSSSGAICEGESRVLTASGVGSSGASYSWASPLSGTGRVKTVTPSSTTTYTVTGTNSNNCSNTASATVTVNSLPIANAGVDQSICLGDNTGISASATGGTSPYSYSWNRGLGVGASQTITPPTTLNYTVTVIDDNSCTDTDVVRVTVNSLPNVTLSSSGAICEGESRVLTASGVGSSGASYSWASPLSGTGRVKTVTPSSTTTYTVTGTNSNNCSNTASATVTVNSLPIANAGVDQSICLGDNTGISASATGGASPYSYSWNRGLGVGASQTITPPTTLNYTVTVTDGNGCVDTDIVRVVVNSLPQVSAGVDQTICSGESERIVATGTATSYTWNRGLGLGITHVITPPTTLLYTVTGVDGNGCENTDAVRIFVSNAFDASILLPDTNICLGDSILNMSTVDGGGVWSGVGVSDVNAGNFNSQLSGVGTYLG